MGFFNALIVHVVLELCPVLLLLSWVEPLLSSLCRLGSFCNGAAGPSGSQQKTGQHGEESSSSNCSSTQLDGGSAGCSSISAELWPRIQSCMGQWLWEVALWESCPCLLAVAASVGAQGAELLSPLLPRGLDWGYVGTHRPGGCSCWSSQAVLTHPSLS